MGPEPGWRVLLTSRESLCLARLALRCGYRIGEICAELACSERHLYGVFIRDAGVPPKEWMRRERMVVARRMLGEGHASGEVALELGFTNPGNFRREFIKCHQVQPCEYQRTARCAGPVR